MTDPFDLPDELPGRLHNNPPASASIEMAETAAKALADFLSAHPVIDASNEAALKIVYDRANLAKRDLDDADDTETKPLYRKWQDALAKYKPCRAKLDSLLSDAGGRIQSYLRAKKAEADRVAEAARLEAARLVAEADAAIAAHDEAVEDSKVGVIVDMNATLDEANRKVEEAQRALRSEARAERDTAVKLKGGFDRGIGLKAPKKVLRLENFNDAISEIGLTSDITEAVFKAARAYKKLHGRLPKGIAEEEVL